MSELHGLSALVQDLMFHGSQKLTLPVALEIAENILKNKVPSLPVTTPEEYKDRVGINSEANKNAAIEAMSKFIHEKVSDEVAFISEVKHWHKVFVSASISLGLDVPYCVEKANQAITELYGQLNFEFTPSGK